MLSPRKPSSWSVVASMCLLAQASLTAAADERSPKQLIDLAPVLNSADDHYRTIELGGYFRANDSAWLTFRAIYQAPDHFAVLIRDGADGTPLLFAADRKLLLYDPIRSIVLWHAGLSIHFALVKEGDALRVHLDATSDEDKPSSVLVDVRSLLAGPFTNDKLVQTGDKKYRLSRTSQKGNTLECAIDLDREQPYTHIAIHADGRPDPVICINTLTVNGNPGREEFLFPKRGRLAEKVSVQDFPDGMFTRNGGELTLLMSASYARAAINKPEMREAVARAGLVDIDWNSAKEKDGMISHALSEALSTASRPK
jgi:hypothetical protein